MRRSMISSDPYDARARDARDGGRRSSAPSRLVAAPRSLRLPQARREAHAFERCEVVEGHVDVLRVGRRYVQRSVSKPIY